MVGCCPEMKTGAAGPGPGEWVQGGLGRFPGWAVGRVSAVHRTEGTAGSGKTQGSVLEVSSRAGPQEEAEPEAEEG